LASVPSDFCVRSSSATALYAHSLHVALPISGIEERIPASLSGGQKKRVGVARATIAKPPIVLYDEPTAGLDPVTSQKIYNLIKRSEEHTSELQSRENIVCRLLLETQNKR